MGDDGKMDENVENFLLLTTGLLEKDEIDEIMQKKDLKMKNYLLSMKRKKMLMLMLGKTCL